MNTCEMVFDNSGLFIVFNGVRIARRHDGARISIEPGFAVYDGPTNKKTGEGSIVIEHNGVPVH